MISPERFGEIHSAERGAMGKKDITLKNYFSDTRRYADLLNGSIFQGKQVIHAEELQETAAKEFKMLVPEYPLHILNLSEIYDYKNFQTELKLLFELYDRRRFFFRNEKSRILEAKNVRRSGFYFRKNPTGRRKN